MLHFKTHVKICFLLLVLKPVFVSHYVCIFITLILLFCFVIIIAMHSLLWYGFLALFRVKILTHISFFLTDHEGGAVKPTTVKKSSESDMYMRLGLLLGDGARRSRRVPERSHESCSSLASYEAAMVMSTNTSPVSTLTGSSEDQHRNNPSSDSVGSLMSMSMSGQSNCSSSPVSRRHSVTSMFFFLHFLLLRKGLASFDNVFL